MVSRAPSGGRDPTPHPSLHSQGLRSQTNRKAWALQRAVSPLELRVGSLRERKKEAAENPEAWYGDFVRAAVIKQIQVENSQRQ